MTGTTLSSTTCAAAPLPTPRVLGGFFVERPEPVAPQDANPPLFLRYELATPSWTEFHDKLDEELERAKCNGMQVKVLYFVRHAEGIHNAKDREVGTPRWEAEFAKSEAFLDADLTPFGVSDAQRKGPESLKQELARGMPPLERVVVSPMSRAIQTAQHFLAHQAPTPFVAFELCRETLGVHTCDKRRTLSELRRKFPDVNFDYKAAAMKEEQDMWWQPEHRETSDEIQARARAFLKQLFQLVPERHVAVVAHSGFIEAVCAITLKKTIHAANCEVIPMVLEMAADDA